MQDFHIQKWNDNGTAPLTFSCNGQVQSKDGQAYRAILTIIEEDTALTLKKIFK